AADLLELAPRHAIAARRDERLRHPDRHRVAAERDELSFSKNNAAIVARVFRLVRARLPSHPVAGRGHDVLSAEAPDRREHAIPERDRAPRLALLPDLRVFPVRPVVGAEALSVMADGDEHGEK